MPRKRPDPNRTAAKQVSKVTKAPLPKGEDLLGSDEARAELAKARGRTK